MKLGNGIGRYTAGIQVNVRNCSVRNFTTFLATHFTFLGLQSLLHSLYTSLVLSYLLFLSPANVYVPSQRNAHGRVHQPVEYTLIHIIFRWRFIDRIIMAVSHPLSTFISSSRHLLPLYGVSIPSFPPNFSSPIHDTSSFLTLPSSQVQSYAALFHAIQCLTPLSFPTMLLGDENGREEKLEP